MELNTSDPLFDILKKYVGEKMTEQIERDRRIAEREQREEESRESGRTIGIYFLIFYLILTILILLAFLAYCIQKRLQSGKSGPIIQKAIAPDEDKLILYTGNPYCEHDTSNAKIWMWAKNNFQNKGSAKLDKILKIGCNLKNVKENLLPTYTRLISIKMHGFDHGEKCYQFSPIDGKADGSYYTCQVYGKNRIQVTNYVIGGKSYVAGFCVFVGPKDLFWEAEYNVNVVKKLMKSEKYPGRDALKKEGGIIVEEENTEETQIPIGFSIQYCRLLQRKVITIEESGVLSHQEWDKFEKKMKTEECKMDPINNTFSDQLMKFVANEMKEEMERKQRRADNSGPLLLLALLILFYLVVMLAMLIPYLWNWWKSGLSGPLTRHPIVPFDLSGLKLYTGMKSTGNQTPEAKIQVSYVSEHLENKANTLNAILRMVFNIKDKKTRLVPYATKTISIKMDGFKHGQKCHDFEPIDGELLGSCYKYKMYGKNRVQVTYYVIGGKSYVAGFCIYIDYSAKDIDFNTSVVKKLIKSAKYPGRKNLEEESGKEAKYVGVGSSVLKFCPRIQRIVMTEEEGSGVVKHQEWDKYEQKMKSEKCEMCSEKWKKEMPPTYSSLSISIV